MIACIPQSSAEGTLEFSMCVFATQGKLSEAETDRMDAYSGRNSFGRGSFSSIADRVEDMSRSLSKATA